MALEKASTKKFAFSLKSKVAFPKFEVLKKLPKYLRRRKI
jgi:hypothetical protein